MMLQVVIYKLLIILCVCVCLFVLIDMFLGKKKKSIQRNTLARRKYWCIKQSHASIKTPSSAWVPMQSYSCKTSLATGSVSQCFCCQVSETWADSTQHGQHAITISRVNNCGNLFQSLLKIGERSYGRTDAAWSWHLGLSLFLFVSLLLLLQQAVLHFFPVMWFDLSIFWLILAL